MSVMMLKMFPASCFLLFTVVIALNGVQVALSAACGTEALAECLKDAPKEPTDTLPHSEEDLNKLCGNLKQAVICIEKFRSECVSEENNALLDGPLKLILGLCSPGDSMREKFLEHAECYNQISIPYKTCEEKIKEETLRVTPQIAADGNIKKLCGVLQNYKECLRSATLSKCNKDAADFTVHMVNIGGGSIWEKSCGPYTDTPYSSSNILRISTGAFFFSLWFILTNQRLIPMLF